MDKHKFDEMTHIISSEYNIYGQANVTDIHRNLSYFYDNNIQYDLYDIGSGFGIIAALSAYTDSINNKSLLNKLYIVDPLKEDEINKYFFHGKDRFWKRAEIIDNLNTFLRTKCNEKYINNSIRFDISQNIPNDEKINNNKFLSIAANKAYNFDIFVDLLNRGFIRNKDLVSFSNGIYDMKTILLLAKLKELDLIESITYRSFIFKKNLKKVTSKENSEYNIIIFLMDKFLAPVANIDSYIEYVQQDKHFDGDYSALDIYDIKYD